MLIISIIERDCRIYNKDFQCRYIGAPCHSFDEARELVNAHCDWGNEISVTSYYQNGTSYAEVSRETGEVIKEYFVRGVESEF